MKAKEETLSFWEINVLLQQQRKAYRIGPGKPSVLVEHARRAKGDDDPKKPVDQTPEYADRLCRRALRHIRNGRGGRAPRHIQVGLRLLFNTRRPEFDAAVAEREGLKGRSAVAYRTEAAV